MKNILKYKKQLLDKRKRIINKLKTIDDRTNSREGLKNSWKESTGELSSYDNHPADNGSDTFERGKDIGIKDNANLFLTMIADALEKIEAGEYGICDKCGSKINEDRLAIMPATTMCYNCKEQVEDQQQKLDRPGEEEAFLDLHKNMYLNITNLDSTGYDGADTWEDLSKAGTSNSPSETINEQETDEISFDAGLS